MNEQMNELSDWDNKFKNKMEAHLNLLTKTASALGFLELN